VRFVWHDYPLPFHESARRPSLRAKRALKKGAAGLWKMHELMFSSDAELSDQSAVNMQPA